MEMRIGLAGLVVDAVADITGLAKEIAGAVDHGFVGQDVFHCAHRHLAYAWPQVIGSPTCPPGAIVILVICILYLPLSLGGITTW